jgi:alanyl-tRNA synthetase
VELRVPEVRGGNEVTTMTKCLYYDDSFLYEFEAQVTEIIPASQAEVRPAVALDRTAFYPTSGGQVFDTGWIARADSSGNVDTSKVIEVAEREDGTIVHFLSNSAPLSPGMRVHGKIDAIRRRDHMQQHSGQHVLSAAFIRLFNVPTVSFHMGVDSCTIDLDTKALAAEQVEAAERLANEIILENRSVDIQYVSQAEAQSMGLRKVPSVGKAELRLIAIHDFDLTACGGTHVRNTGQIGCILLRKTEKVRQGVRVEFVCGQRAVATTRRDYLTLAEAAELYSAHIWDLPQQIRKAQEESKAARRSREELLEELVKQHALRLVAEAPVANGRKVVVSVFAERDLPFIRLLAQKCTQAADNVIALLASTSGHTALVFAQSAGQPFDMGGLMKEALMKLGGRGGGSRDLAQGGTSEPKPVEPVLLEVKKKLFAAAP